MESINIHRLRNSAVPEFGELLRIYEDAIPASERKNAAALAEMVARPEYVFLTICDEEAVVGFSICICFGEAALLEYVAVDRAHRGKGIGSALFRQTVALPELSGRFVLIEVDSDAEPGPEQQACERRKAFYRRLGCRQIEGLHYRMPRVGTEEPPPMDILVYRASLPDSVETPRLRRWLEACYTQVYGQQPNDPRIAAMLNDLEPRVRLCKSLSADYPLHADAL